MSEQNEQLKARDRAFAKWHKRRRYIDREHARLAWDEGYYEGRRAQPAPTVQQTSLPDHAPSILRDMLVIQEVCGLHTDEYAPGSVIEYIKELEADVLPTAQPAELSPDTKTLQFLTDVVTASGLLEHGRMSKGLAARISARAYELREALYAAPAHASSDGRDAKDAARYRWLRDEHIGDDPDAINLLSAKRPGLDAAIDAALAGTGVKGGGNG